MPTDSSHVKISPSSLRSRFHYKRLYQIGRYTGISILQGGSGLPLFSESVYSYMSTGKLTGFEIPNGLLPDHTLRYVVEKVSGTILFD